MRFVPGERDVLVKATPLRSVLSFLESNVPGGRETVLDRAAAEFPAEVARLRERTPLPSDRFPVVFVNRLIELGADELHRPATEVAHRLGRFAAEEAAGGILRLAMMMISIPSLLRKLGPVWKQLYSHGTMDSTSDGSTATVELHDFPVVSATGCARITGWFEWFAGRAEKSVVVRHSECRASGAMRCRWDLRW